jgi:hypothetical protein
MVVYNSIQIFFIEKNIHFFTFYTKAGKPFKVVIRHLPADAEDKTVALQERDYVCINVKQMTAKCPTPE